jgi:3-isopropylmalate dehydratase
MLPVAMARDALERIATEARAGREIEVDLPAQVVKSADGKELGEFEMESFRKHCLVNGLDDIGLTTQLEAKIHEFERRMTQHTPWLDGTGYLKRKGPVMVEVAPVPKTNRGEVKNEPLEW